MGMITQFAFTYFAWSFAIGYTHSYWISGICAGVAFIWLWMFVFRRNEYKRLYFLQCQLTEEAQEERYEPQYSSRHSSDLWDD